MTIDQQLRASREATVNRHIAAENSGDLNGLVASFHHPRYEVIPMGATFDGAQQVKDLIGGLLAAFPDFHFSAITIHHADHAVIVEGRLTGTQHGLWAGIPPKGGKLDSLMVCIYVFENDRLVSEKVYFDFAAVQRQLA